MKKKFLYMTAIVATAQLFNGCKKELDVNPQERITLDNYYKTEADAFAGLVAVYDRFGFQAGGLYDKSAIMDVAVESWLFRHLQGKHVIVENHRYQYGCCEENTLYRGNKSLTRGVLFRSCNIFQKHSFDRWSC